MKLNVELWLKNSDLLRFDGTNSTQYLLAAVTQLKINMPGPDDSIFPDSRTFFMIFRDLKSISYIPPA